MKTRANFTHRVDMWDDAGENIVEHLAGVEDFEVAEATYRAALKRWPRAVITLRASTRVIHDSRKEPSDVSDDGIDRRSPLGYYNYAASYHAAADLIAAEGLEATHPSAPATAMFCHAVELYLKSFLRLHGVSAMRLWWIGHDYRKLLLRARSYGLALSEHDDAVVERIGAADIWGRSRYLETGFYRSPPTHTISGTCRALKQSVCDAFRAAGQPMRAPSHRNVL